MQDRTEKKSSPTQKQIYTIKKKKFVQFQIIIEYGIYFVRLFNTQIDQKRRIYKCSCLLLRDFRIINIITTSKFLMS